MALNGELQALGGRLLEATTTAPDYKLYALDTTPPKPGMLRVDAGAGDPIKLELWALSAAAFGKFVAAIPPPLGIGTIRLADGRGVKGFIVEPVAVTARAISRRSAAGARSWRRRRGFSRHCERSEAIHLSTRQMDCFVASLLAKTGCVSTPRLLLETSEARSGLG